MRRTRALGVVDHAAGLLAAVVLMKWSAEIVTAISWGLSRLCDRGGGVGKVLLMGGASGPRWGGLIWFGLLVAVVVAADASVRAGLLRAWAPPLAVFVIVTPIVMLVIGQTDIGGLQGRIVGATIGALVAAIVWTAPLSLEEFYRTLSTRS